MATEALDRLREFACTKSCQDAIEALGMLCDDFSCCKDCAEARARAASALLDEVGKRLMPEGMEWPRFEDGSPVRIGDEIALKERTATVDSIQIHRPWAFSLWYDGGFASATYFDDAPVKRPEPEDTQERIDEDAGKTPCEYFGRKGELCSAGDGCPSLEMGCSCDTAKTLDLLRRQRELDARKDGAR